MDITKQTTADQDAAFEYMARVRSERLPVPMTALDLLVAVVDGAVADIVAEYTSRNASARNAAYGQTTTQERAIIDPILDKYRTDLAATGRSL